MAVILAQSSTHRTTGDSRIWYLSDIPALDSETATGTGLPTIAALTQAGQLSSSISETEWHRAQGVQSTTQSDVSITYTNDTAGSSGGPLDEWRDYTFNEHDSILYVDGDIIWRGTHRGEPSFSNSLQSRTVTSVLARPRGPQIILRKWAGIPTGVERLTAATSAATAPTNTAYDTSEFTVVAHWRGGLRGRAIERRNVSFQFTITYSVATSTLTCLYSPSGGGSNVVIYNSTFPLAAPFHWAAMSVSTEKALFVVDGVVLGSVDSPATPFVATGTSIGLGGAASGFTNTTSGHAFLSRAMSEEELLSLDYSSLALDTATESIWRGDDGTGSTITDYGPLANHATISGTAGVDWQWVAADSGDPELAGQLIPELYGHQRLTPARQIDQSRSRHVIARNPLDISTATVREGGVSITPTTITSTGVIDLSGSPTKPVTVDTENTAFAPTSVIQQFLDGQWPTSTRDEVSMNEAFGTSLYQGQGGIYVTQESSVEQILTDSVRGLGGWWDIYNDDGRLAFGFLTQPAPAAPLERYLQAGGIATNAPLNFPEGSVTGWVLCRSQSVQTWTYSDLSIRITPGTSNEAGQQTLNFSIIVTASPHISTTVVTNIPRNVWVFFGIRSESDGVGGTDYTIYVRPTGESAITLVESQPFFSPAVGPLAKFTGGRLCSWQDVAYYDTLLSTTDFDNLFAQSETPASLNATWHAPLSTATLHSGGNGWISDTAIPAESGAIDLFGYDGLFADPAPITQPEAHYDLRVMPDAKFQFEHTTSISAVNVSYDNGPGALSNTDLGALVSSADRPNLQTEWFKVSVSNSLEEGEVDKSHDVESLVGTRPAALAVGRVIADTNKGSLYLVEVTGLPRSAASLTPHAEILLTDREGAQWTVRVVRRLTNNPLNPDTSGTILGLGRKL